MKPAWFDYHAPDNLDEALMLLDDAGVDGRVLAGGQSLMPMLNMRILSPSVLVDINRIEALDTLDAGADTLRLGALVRHVDLLRDPSVREGWPLLAEATTQIAHPTIRNRGTVCGSISHNDPAAEHPSLLVTLGGTVVAASEERRREIPAEEFFDGAMSTTLEPGEMVVEVRYPRPQPGAVFGFVEFARRLGDFAIAGAAVMLTHKDGICQSARVTIIGMGGGPFRARAAEAAMVGSPMGANAFAAAAEEVRKVVVPTEDVHASSSYRRHLAGVMAVRALEQAAART
ncbi:MAG: FAD binding domain-containing protein [Hyphomicrobiales bacterium]